MATTKPGEIRCPSCLRSTPPAAFCTQCGAPIPSDLRVRPRGMDRDELQERIRARRSGAEPYRRGLAAGETGAGYERFEPEPGDATARREAEPAGAPRADHFDDAAEEPPLTREGIDEWPEADRWTDEGPAAAAPAAQPPPYAGPADRGYEEPGYQADPHYEERDAQATPSADEYAGPYADAYAYGAGDDEPEAYPYAYEDRVGGRRAGGGRSGVIAILGFLGLGVAALLGGAFLANLFGDGGVGGLPSPTPTEAIEPTPVPTAQPTAEATGNATPEPTGVPGDEGPVEFPDGAIVYVQSCASQRMNFPTQDPPGCIDDGSVITGDAMWVWMGFHRSFSDDTLVLSLRSGETTIEQQQWVLGDAVNCSDPCTGYLIQGYRGLQPGDYELVLERNGEFGARATFRVEG